MCKLPYLSSLLCHPVRRQELTISLSWKFGEQEQIWWAGQVGDNTGGAVRVLSQLAVQSNACSGEAMLSFSGSVRSKLVFILFARSLEPDQISRAMAAEYKWRTSYLSTVLKVEALVDKEDIWSIGCQGKIWAKEWNNGRKWWDVRGWKDNPVFVPFDIGRRLWFARSDFQGFQELWH